MMLLFSTLKLKQLERSEIKARILFILEKRCALLKNSPPCYIHAVKSLTRIFNHALHRTTWPLHLEFVSYTYVLHAFWWYFRQANVMVGGM